ncbi:hypothetical protein A6E27_22980 [Bacillus cereus]|nr:hypothetical protein A6E27_22980 [Bacillus cereus]
MNLAEIIKEHGVDLKEENVVLAYEDGYIEVSLEDGDLSVNVQLTDKVIKLDGSIEDALGGIVS